MAQRHAGRGCAEASGRKRVARMAGVKVREPEREGDDDPTIIEENAA
jgi:hypothetical protein